MNIFSNYWFLFRYGVVGISGGIIQTGTLYAWVELLHLQTYYLLGATIGFCLALMVTFALQKYWTFKDFIHTQIKKQFFMYTSIALINLSLNISLLHLSKLVLEALGLNFFHIWYLIVQVGIIVFLASFSFLSNYFITFKAHHPRPTDTKG